jgi:hypothetical protein
MRKKNVMNEKELIKERRNHMAVISDLRLRLSEKNTVVREFKELFDRQAKEILRLQNLVNAMRKKLPPSEWHG